MSGGLGTATTVIKHHRDVSIWPRYQKPTMDISLSATVSSWERDTRTPMRILQVALTREALGPATANRAQSP